MDVLSLVYSIPGIGPYTPYIGMVVTMAAALAVILPPPSANAGTPYKLLYGAVQWCALNKGHAANASAPK